MNILVPKNVFLRVEDKFVPSFIDSDQAVATSPTLLYKKLFAECYATGKCRLPQKFLAGQCKFSVRTLQYAQVRLVELGYIHVEHTPGECSSYILLLSDRVRKLLVADDLIDPRRKSVSQIQTPPQNLRGGYAKPAHPSYKEDKREKSSPLSPHSPVKANRESVPSTRAPSRSTLPVPAPQAGGWGDSHSRDKRRGKSVFRKADALFERFFAAYPRKEAKEPARAAWHQLWRRGALPALEELMASLERFRTSAQWLKEHGRFVPFLVNWLRGQRWADVTNAPASSSPGVQCPPFGAPARATATAENPRHAQALRHCLQRLEERHRPDPVLEAARPAFESFLSHFADGQRKRGPAWGLWASLFQRGKAPSAEDVKERGMMDAFAFLQAWQRGAYAPA